MTREEILEKAKSKEGLWVLQRNIAAEKVFPTGLLSPEQIYSPVKLICDGDLLEIISFNDRGTPLIYAYPFEHVDFDQEDGQLILNIRGEREFCDFYPEPEETREEFLKHFHRCWGLSREEYERYGIEKDTKSLPVLGIDRLAK